MQASQSASFLYQGQRLTFSEYGSGARVVVLLPGLLLPRRMQDPLACRLAQRGSRVLTLDLLGHGDSDRPEGSWHYSMSRFADQAVALLDHLDIERAAIGGTSLGANVALEAGARHPERASALILEMPVLDGSQLAASAIFTPLGLGLSFGALPLRPFTRVARLLPRGVTGSGHLANLVDTGLDWLSQDPQHVSTVLVGLAYGRTAPPREERERLKMPILIIAHSGDPIHALADSKTAARDLPNAELVRARTFFEMRFAPGRLSDQVADFLDRQSKTPEEPVVSDHAADHAAAQAVAAPSLPRSETAQAADRTSGLRQRNWPALAGPDPSPLVDPEDTLVAELADQEAADGAGAELHVEEPWRGYRSMRVADIVDRLKGTSAETLAAVQLYEQFHKQRQGVLTAVDRELKRS